MSETLRTFGVLGWPSPVLDPHLDIDPYVGAQVHDGRIELSLASGDRVEARCSAPTPGVLRIRIGTDLGPPAPSPMLTDLDEQPTRIEEVADGIRVNGDGVDALWSPNGDLAVGAWRRSPLVGIITASAGGAGRLTGPDGPTGFLETFHLPPDAAVYGGGESFQGPDLRGRIRRLVNSETHGAAALDLSYLNVPFFWSDAGWGVFVHSGGPVRADLGATHSEVGAVAAEGGELDVFVISGGPTEILRRYLVLTGLPGPLPDWAFGVWTSRCSYLSAEEISELLDAYEEASCPVDVVHVDAWLTRNVVSELTCNWTVDRDRFPDGWARRLQERGVRVSLWHNPYVLEGSPLAAELDEAGYLVAGPGGSPATTNDKPDRFLLDFTNPDAVEWWQEQVRRVVREEGVDTFKPDFAEEVPDGGRFADGRMGRELRNVYALLYQRATAEALGSDPVALFCRSGTAGAQRHPCHWVGDTPSTWDGLTSALRACLSLSLSGFGAVAHDVGGFWTPEAFEWVAEAFERMDPSPFEADVDGELYARWTQWGALTPLMRFHGTGRREPFAYPEPYRSAAIEACRLRERLRSYLVEAARQAATEGTPMMRPMPLAFAGDRAARDATLQYLLGDDVLVAPVLQPGGRRRLFVPEGTWRGLWGLDDLTGPGWAEVECPLEVFPAFVRPDAPWPVEDA